MDKSLDHLGQISIRTGYVPQIDRWGRNAQDEIEKTWGKVDYRQAFNFKITSPEPFNPWSLKRYGTGKRWINYLTKEIERGTK